MKIVGGIIVVVGIIIIGSTGKAQRWTKDNWLKNIGIVFLGIIVLGLGLWIGGFET